MPLPNHSTPSTDTRVKKFEREFYAEYISQSKFKPYMGTSEGAMIQTKMETKDVLERIQFNLINKATGTGKRGTEPLKGNEQQVKDRTFDIQIDLVREGFASHKRDRKWTAYDMMKAQRHVAKEWIMETTKLEISEQLRSVNGKLYDNQVINDATNFPVSSDAERDAWQTDNEDRILFGDAIGNTVTGDHSASLASITSGMKCTADTLDILKRMAYRNAGPKIRPIRTKGDELWYVVWADSYVFADLYRDQTIQAFHSQALPRVRDSNPFFTGGDLIWKGMIIKENEDFPTLSGVGAGGTVDVGTVALCGAQALGIAWGQTTQFPEETDDYGALKGIAAEEIRGIKKMLFGSGANDREDLKDHGVATGFFAFTGD